MSRKARLPLTMQRIEAVTCPSGKAMSDLWDGLQPGLLVRVYPTGRKVYMAFYRAGSGRRAVQRWSRLADVRAITLKQARDAVRQLLGSVVQGVDPIGDRRVESKGRLGPALDDYEASLQQRQVVKARDRMALLRRELKPLGDVPLARIERSQIVDLITGIERSGRPGAAQDLRKNVAVFLGWAVDAGLLRASPLAGWRQPRRTRAQLVARPGRALEDWELKVIWRAAEAAPWPFGTYLQMLILLGQRRGETAAMFKSDVDLEAGVWTIPDIIAKSGRRHRVPLPPVAVEILRMMPRAVRCDLMFPGRGCQPISGWSKRLLPIMQQTEAAGMRPWTLHDLRRSYRSALGRLSVDRIVCELMLGHVVSDELTAIYDRGDYWPARVEAAARWGEHVADLVSGG